MDDGNILNSFNSPTLGLPHKTFSIVGDIHYMGMGYKYKDFTLIQTPCQFHNPLTRPLIFTPLFNIHKLLFYSYNYIYKLLFYFYNYFHKSLTNFYCLFFPNNNLFYFLESCFRFLQCFCFLIRN